MRWRWTFSTRHGASEAPAGRAERHRAVAGRRLYVPLAAAARTDAVPRPDRPTRPGGDGPRAVRGRTGEATEGRRVRRGLDQAGRADPRRAAGRGGQPGGRPR